MSIAESVLSVTLKSVRRNFVHIAKSDVIVDMSKWVKQLA